MSDYLYDIYNRDGTILFENLEVNEAIEKTGLSFPTLRYKALNPDNKEDIKVTRKIIPKTKTQASIKTAFPIALVREWDNVHKAAQMIKNGTGKRKRVCINGEYVLRTVPV